MAAEKEWSNHRLSFLLVMSPAVDFPPMCFSVLRVVFGEVSILSIPTVAPGTKTARPWLKALRATDI